MVLSKKGSYSAAAIIRAILTSDGQGQAEIVVIVGVAIIFSQNLRAKYCLNLRGYSFIGAMGCELQTDKPYWRKALNNNELLASMELQ